MNDIGIKLTYKSRIKEIINKHLDLRISQIALEIVCNKINHQIYDMLVDLKEKMPRFSRGEHKGELRMKTIIKQTAENWNP